MSVFLELIIVLFSTVGMTFLLARPVAVLAHRGQDNRGNMQNFASDVLYTERTGRPKR